MERINKDKMLTKKVAKLGNVFGATLPQHRAYPTSTTHNFYLYGPIVDLPEYVDMITMLDTAQEADQVHIYINTPGGELNATISIIHAMLRTQAQVITHADGEVASAGTLIFFAAPMRVVYPYSSAMFHDASSGMIGKVNENVKNIRATSDLVRKMAYDMYIPTFTKEEVDSILSGVDYYCDAEELYDRIINASEEETEGNLKVGDKVKISNPRLKTANQFGTIESLNEERVTLRLESGQVISYGHSSLSKR
jgi:ATP-dependent protease ClpP protease subunit